MSNDHVLYTFCVVFGQVWVILCFTIFGVLSISHGIYVLNSHFWTVLNNLLTFSICFVGKVLSYERDRVWKMTKKRGRSDEKSISPMDLWKYAFFFIHHTFQNLFFLDKWPFGVFLVINFIKSLPHSLISGGILLFHAQHTHLN